MGVGEVGGRQRKVAGGGGGGGERMGRTEEGRTRTRTRKLYFTRIVV